MGNMSYCKFQNTSHDFNDCLGTVNRLVEEDESALSRDELQAAKDLAVSALEMLQMLADNAGKDLSEITEEDLENSIEDLNEKAKNNKNNN